MPLSSATAIPTKEKAFVDIHAMGMMNMHAPNHNGLHAKHRKVLQWRRPFRLAQGLAIGGQPSAQTFWEDALRLKCGGMRDTNSDLDKTKSDAEFHAAPHATPPARGTPAAT